MMQYGRLALAQALTQGQWEKDFENEFISKLYIRIKGAAGTDGPTAAELKAMMIQSRILAGGKQTEIHELSFFDAAALSDFSGGFAGSFHPTDKWPEINIVLPLGIDLSGANAGHFELRLIFPATIANTTFSVWSINDGSRPNLFRYRTKSSAGQFAYEKPLKLYSRDETDGTSDIKIGSDKIKTIDHDMGRVALQEWASLEASSIFGQLVSQEVAEPVVITPSASMTVVSVEAL
ncbi:MAG: hypothetical protein JSR44_09490 [Spirochaetes bacterium]|nr:hypothetical protein [Spirochaetota bacterium]